MDQCFSCISRLLRRLAVWTINALGRAIVKAFTGRQGKPEIFDLKDTADVKSWLAPFTNSVNNITGSHQYVFERKVVNGETKAVLSCKQFAACGDDKLFTVGTMLKVRPSRLCLFRNHTLCHAVSLAGESKILAPSVTRRNV